MAVLLTGGAGFIGSHTAVELINAGYSVIMADDFSNSSESVLDNLEKITGKKIPCYKINVADTKKLDALFSENDIEAVVHFAGLKAVGESVKKPTQYYRNNIDATLSLLEIMPEHNCKTFVFSSSATVYGADAPVPYTEETTVGQCTNPYGRTKYFIEQMLTDAAVADDKLSVVLLRYFNPIGAHESGLIGELPSGVPNNLMPYIAQTAAGIREKLLVFGNDYPTCDGTGVRDYIHVVDLAKGHVAALKYAKAHNGAEAINLGTGRGTSVLEMIAAFEKVNGIKIPYEVTERRAGDLPEYYAVTEKAERLLGWRAEKNLEDMCRDSWRWQNYLSGKL